MGKPPRAAQGDRRRRTSGEERVPARGADKLIVSSGGKPKVGKLQQRVDHLGINLEDLAARLHMRTSTVRQYLKPSHQAPADFIRKATVALGHKDDDSAIYRETRASLREKNRSQFGTTSFQLYHDFLPVIPIENLPPCAVLNEPTTETFPHESKALPWEKWRELAFNTLAGVYRLQYALPGDHVVVLMGSPGAGKTTEAKRLLLYLQDERGADRTCILIPLSIYNTSEPSSLFAAARLFYQRKLGLQLPMDMDFERFLRLEVEHHRLVLILDSLDEADYPHRRRILNQVEDLDGHRELRVPIMITSRYVPPRLDRDGRLRASPRWHLAGLQPAQIAAHVESMVEHFGRSDAAKQIPGPFTAYRNRMHDLNERLQSFIQDYTDYSVASGDEQQPASTELGYKRLAAERAWRRLRVLAKPLFLHLHIAFCLDKGVAEWTIDSIIGRYVDFLLGKWAGVRSASPRDDHHLDGRRASLVRALAYIGYALTEREHQELPAPSLGDVEQLLIDYSRAMGHVSENDDEVREFVREQMDRARTAEIFEPNSLEPEVGQVRFNSPGDVLREHHLAQFIEQCTNLAEAASYRTDGYRWWPPDLPSIANATYARFLADPSLRFLEQGHVKYFQRIFDSGSFLRPQINVRFALARETPPVAPALCGCSSEDLRLILPLNLMFLARAMEGDIHHDYGQLHDQLREEIKSIHDHTHFEVVYRALRDLVHPVPKELRRSQDLETYASRIDKLIAEVNLESQEGAEEADLLWRELPTAPLLVRLARGIEPTGGAAWKHVHRNRQKLLRRIAYVLRHHQASFDDDAGEWLMWLHRWADTLDHNQVTLNVPSLVMDTQRVLRTPLSKLLKASGRLKPAMKDLPAWWRYFDEEERSYRRRVEGWQRALNKAWTGAQMRGSARTFVDRVIRDCETFPFEGVLQTGTYMRRLLETDLFDVGAAVAGLAERLRDPSIHQAVEGKTHLFLRLIARSYRGQRALLPPSRPEKQDQRLEILRHLFQRVLPHLPKGLTDDVAGREGALQPYDFAAEAIWAILYRGAHSDDADLEWDQ